MSTVPNRYYNSPWLQDVGQNLASALAPPDPEKTLAAQRSKWQFDREQELAQVEDEQRARKEAAIPAVGRLIADDYGSVIQNGTGAEQQGFAQWMGAGQPEAAAVDPNAPTRTADLTAVAGGGASLGDVMALAGPEGPKSRAALALAKQKYEANKAMFGEKAALQIALKEMGGDDSMERVLAIIAGQNYRQGVGNEHDFDLQDRKFDNDMALVSARGEAAARAKGATPYPIAGAVYKDIRLAVRGLERQYRLTLDPEERREVEARIGEKMQDPTMRNVPLAAQTIFKETGLSGGAPPTKTVPVPGKYWGTNEEPRLAPNFSDAIPSDGDVGPSPLEPPAWQADSAPAPSSGPAEGTRSVSKSGKPTIFRNGRWEYQ